MSSAYSADPVFEANGRLISYLLQRIHDRELALPDFQRDFVWETAKTAELLRSIMSRFPAGTLLVWKQGTETEGFAAREIEGAPKLGGKQPDELILDGQQRLTALYSALSGVGDDRFYARLSRFVDEEADEILQVDDVDFDKAIVTYPRSDRLRFDPDDREYQFSEDLFPLAQLNNFDEWLDEYAPRKATLIRDEGRIKKQMRAVRDTYFVPLRSYGFPVVTLPSTTPIVAVCNIFETINRTGKPLGAFDLVTARLFPKDVRLRDLWEEAKSEYSLLEDFAVEPYSVLQSVTLRARNSAQRSDVLANLNASDVEEHWLDVVGGFAGVLDQLQSECGVLAKRWLPYTMMLVPAAAVWADIKQLKPLDRSGALDRLRQYFWCTTFMTNFEQGANSQAGADFARLRGWLLDPEQDAPEAVADFKLTASTLSRAGVRRKALHAGVMALTIRSGAKDFHTSQKLTAASVKERRIESHHVFPKAFLKNTSTSELLLNRALIDSETNKIIGKSAPSVYIEKMLDTNGEKKIMDVLTSHAIDAGEDSGLRTDDFEKYLLERLKGIVELIEDATKKEVVWDLEDA